MVGAVRQVAGRAGLETAYAATLLLARGPGVARTPPYGLLGALRDVVAYRPVGAAVSLVAASDGGRVAIVDELGEITFDELDRRSNALAKALLAKTSVLGTPSASSLATTGISSRRSSPARSSAPARCWAST